jgi:hypothetical protein
MEKRSTSLAIKEIQIKTMLRFYLTPVRMAKIKNTNDNKHWQGYRTVGGWGKESSYTVGGNIN